MPNFPGHLFVGTLNGSTQIVPLFIIDAFRSGFPFGLGSSPSRADFGESMLEIRGIMTFGDAPFDASFDSHVFIVQAHIVVVEGGESGIGLRLETTRSRSTVHAHRSSDIERLNEFVIGGVD